MQECLLGVNCPENLGSRHAKLVSLGLAAAASRCLTEFVCQDALAAANSDLRPRFTSSTSQSPRPMPPASASITRNTVGCCSPPTGARCVCAKASSLQPSTAAATPQESVRPHQLPASTLSIPLSALQRTYSPNLSPCLNYRQRAFEMPFKRGQAPAQAGKLARPNAMSQVGAPVSRQPMSNLSHPHRFTLH
jgi:hypothetical protein